MEKAILGCTTFLDKNTVTIINNKNSKNPPAPKVLGRDRPDGTRKRLQVYLGGGAFFGQNLLFLIGRDVRLQKTL